MRAKISWRMRRVLWVVVRKEREVRGERERGEGIFFFFWMRGRGFEGWEVG